MAMSIAAILIAFSNCFVPDAETVPDDVIVSTTIRSVPDVAGIHNICAIGDAVISGSQPEGLAAFEALRAMGVRVVVSVDGSVPDVGAARRAGLQYIHIPIGYDGIRRTDQLALSRVLAENSGNPIFIHCHHGRHRGPAAAAVACRMNKLLDDVAARSLLEQARTGKEYAGLWKSVRTCQPVRPNETLPPLKESVSPPEVVAMMKQIEEQFDLTRQTATDFKSRRAEFDSTRAVLSQLFRETARLPDAAAYTAELVEAADEALQSDKDQSVAESVGRWQSRLQKRCTACHSKYRDNSASVDSSTSAADRKD